ncbi:MAG: hypothetical protein AABY09_01375 [Nanoarchaeota archaeon]
MDRKAYLEQFRQEMESRYQPSDRMKSALRVQVNALLDPRITDGAFHSLVRLVEETYQRSSDIRANCDSARKSLNGLSSDLTETAQKLSEAVREYGKLTTTVMQTYAAMAGTLNSAGKVIAAQGQTIRRLAEDNEKLETEALEVCLKENPPKAKA